MRMKVVVMLSIGVGEGGGMWVARDVGKISSGSSPLPSIDMLKGNAIVEQLQLQKAKRSTKATCGHMDDMAMLHLKERKKNHINQGYIRYKIALLA